uniref:Uncharacterized protein n=2 Tax=Paracidobacterium acidisoli TaxID=2303751 RepID=A0A372ILB1_9BACT
MDESLPALRRAVPALDDLKENTNPPDLQSILDRTAAGLEAELPKVPDLSAHESVSQTYLNPQVTQNDQNSGSIAGVGAKTVGINRAAPAPQYTTHGLTDERELEQNLQTSLLAWTSRGDFDYLILVRHSPAGDPRLEESRTDLKDPKNAKMDLHGIGFGYLWLLFLPQNLSQSRFRCLGEEKMEGRHTYVVAFAQLPDRVKSPGEIMLPGATYPLLYQGIAWIDAATYRIVRLRADLLAPLADLQLQRITSDLRFSEVHLSDVPERLWLPSQVEVIWQQQGVYFGELHLYRKYHLFHATVRILPAG